MLKPRILELSEKLPLDTMPTEKLLELLPETNPVRQAIESAPATSSSPADDFLL